jgi:hypothetical protein
LTRSAGAICPSTFDVAAGGRARNFAGTIPDGTLALIAQFATRKLPGRRRRAIGRWFNEEAGAQFRDTLVAGTIRSRPTLSKCMDTAGSGFSAEEKAYAPC